MTKLYGCIFNVGFVTVLGHFLESLGFQLSQRMLGSLMLLLCSVRTWSSVCRIRTAVMEMRFLGFFVGSFFFFSRGWTNMQKSYFGLLLKIHRRECYNSPLEAVTLLYSHMVCTQLPYYPSRFCIISRVFCILFLSLQGVELGNIYLISIYNIDIF